MVADYDSEGDTLQIELEPLERIDSDDPSLHPRLIVSLVDGRVGLVEVLQASEPLEEPLSHAAERYGLDLEALLAAGRSALAAPDRRVELSVGARA